MLNVEKIKELMALRDVSSIKQLAIKTGIPYTTLRYMITGHDLYVGTLIELSKFFKVPLDDLVNKSYSIVSYTEKEVIYTTTTNIFEATMSNMM